MKQTGIVGNNLIDELQNEYQNELYGWGNNGLLHTIGVARMCYIISRKFFNYDIEKSQQMFVMGLLHDFGYEFEPDAESDAHAKFAAQTLSAMGFDKDLVSAIEHHHDTLIIEHKNEYSEEILILKLADLISNGKGEFVDFDARIKDLASRHHNNDIIDESIKTVEFFRKTGFLF